MNNEIVKYHNDFNKIKIPNFKALQQNILFSILQRCQHETSIIFTPSELNTFVRERNFTNKELFCNIRDLKDNFFKADFTIISKQDIGNDRLAITETTINLFKKFTIHYEADKKGTRNERFIEFTKLEVEVNEEFKYLLQNIIGNFTAFQLSEFTSLSGSYPKTLYRLLKQFRSTGKVNIYENKWEEFREFMGIPDTYTSINIDERVLKPAVKELTKPRTLFDKKRIPFKNLSYTKIKAKRRGAPIIGIIFEFTPEDIEKQENLRVAKLLENQKHQISYKWLIGRKINFRSKTYEIRSIKQEEYGRKTYVVEAVEYGEVDTETGAIVTGGYPLRLEFQDREKLVVEISKILIR